jgi:hypothetical protein
MRAPTPVRERRAGRWPTTRSRALGVCLAGGLGLGLTLATATATATASAATGVSATSFSAATGVSAGTLPARPSAVAKSAAGNAASPPTITVAPDGPAPDPAHSEPSNAGTPANTDTQADANAAAAERAPGGATMTGPDGTAQTGLDPSTRPANGTGATGWIGSDIGVAAFISGLAMLGLIAAADQRRLVADRRRR